MCKTNSLRIERIQKECIAILEQRASASQAAGDGIDGRGVGVTGESHLKLFSLKYHRDNDKA